MIIENELKVGVTGLTVDKYQKYFVIAHCLTNSLQRINQIEIVKKQFKTYNVTKIRFKEPCMLLLKKFHGYLLLIPHQYHNSRSLTSIDTLEKCFYQEKDELFYTELFKEFKIYSKPAYYELRLRGCLISSQALSAMDDWLFLESADDDDQTINQLILEYLPKKSPVRQLIKDQCNDYFSLMPLQCIHQFLVGITFNEFKKQLEWLATVATLTYLKTAPIIHSQQLSTYYEGCRMNIYCQQYLIEQTIYYYEELQEFHWYLVGKLHFMREEKTLEMAQYYQEKVRLKQRLLLK